ncbi:MAG: hypothetical protein ACI4EU_03830 [Butyrivibrio sp.]
MVPEQFRKGIEDAVTQMGNLAKHADQAETDIYNTFAGQLGEWSRRRELPRTASQDTKYYLELQSKKMDSMGVAVTEQLKERKRSANITGSTFEDSKYISRRLFKSLGRTATYYQNGKKKLKNNDNIIMYEMVTSAKQGQISPQESYCCPNCGAVSTISELQSGCPYCQTRFLMSDLFPKVTNFFHLHDYGMNSSELGKKLLIWALIGFLAGIPIGCVRMVSGLGNSTTAEMTMTAMGHLISTPFLGIVAGIVFFLLLTVGRLIIDSIRVTPILAKTATTKQRLNAVMRQYDPYFSYEFFESRVIALLKIMLYCDEKENLAVYAGSQPAPRFDVVDAVYRGAIALNSCNVQDGDCEIDLDIYMDDVHAGKGKMKRQNDVFRMKLVKSIETPTDIGFSIKKVNCRSCGGSFDATRVKCCPYCDSDYILKKDDWVVVKVEKR